jgi:hypothetical protein
MLENYQNTKATAPSEDDAIILNDWTDDEEAETALDKHDPYSLLVHSMNALQSSHPAQFQVSFFVSFSCRILQIVFLSCVPFTTTLISFGLKDVGLSFVKLHWMDLNRL